MAQPALLVVVLPMAVALGGQVDALSPAKVELPVTDATASLASWLSDEAVLEAITEALCTLGIFFAVWALGKFFTYQRPGQDAKSKGKVRNKGATAAKTMAVLSSAQQKPALSKADTDSDASTAASTRDRAPRPSTGFDRHARGTRSPLALETDKLAAAVRSDRAPQLPALVDAAMSRLSSRGAAVTESIEEQCAQLLLASLRSCAAKRHFAEALAVFDHVVRICGGDPCSFGACGSTWSLLLWSAVETAEFHRCEFFLSQLCDVGSPTSYDFVNLVRYAAQRRDVKEFNIHLDRFFHRGCTVDLLARNRALAICVSGRALELADAIVAKSSVDLDVIAYNTLMKGYATSYNPQKCFELYSRMRGANIMPTQMTFGILLDACIDAQEMDNARKVYNDIKQSGLALNVVLYTTFIKGLVNAGQLGEALDILDEMSASPGNEPDLVTFSTLVKANAERGNVAEAVKLLERMVKQGISPDSVVYNTVLTGCCAKPMDPAAILHVFRWLVSRGLKPSTATLSVLIKAFSLSEAWDTALEELEAAPTRYNVWLEARVYGQLAQACARAGYGPGALQSYLALVRAACARGVPVNKAINTRLLRLCHSCGQGTAAADMHQAIVDAANCIDAGLVKKLEAIVEERKSAALPRKD